MHENFYDLSVYISMIKDLLLNIRLAKRYEWKFL